MAARGVLAGDRGVMVSGLHPRRVDTPMAPATAAAPAILPKCRTARCARARRAMRVQALPQRHVLVPSPSSTTDEDKAGEEEHDHVGGKRRDQPGREADLIGVLEIAREDGVHGL